MNAPSRTSRLWSFVTLRLKGSISVEFEIAKREVLKWKYNNIRVETLRERYIIWLIQASGIWGFRITRGKKFK
jgi:hypothetical protein